MLGGKGRLGSSGGESSFGGGGGASSRFAGLVVLLGDSEDSAEVLEEPLAGHGEELSGRSRSPSRGLLLVLTFRSCLPILTGLLLERLPDVRCEGPRGGSKVAGDGAGSGSIMEEIGNKSFLRWLTTSIKEYEVASATHAKSPLLWMAPTPPSSMSLNFLASSPIRIRRSLCLRDMTIIDPFDVVSGSSSSSFLSSPPTQVHPACLIFPPNAGLNSGSV